jgi:hypothetical protein
MKDLARTKHDPEKWAPVFGKDHAQSEHDPEKWVPVFGKDHAQSNSGNARLRLTVHHAARSLG